MINVFDRYVLKILATATFVTALSLTMIILLTQSIRYLEMVIGSDSSAYYFLLMIGLAIPKFLEAIMPLAFAIGAIYTAQRLLNSREIIIMTAAGVSTKHVARAFFIFTGFMMVMQFLLSAWLSPIAVSQLQQTRNDVKSHYATLLFREGVFNTLGSGLTVFVKQRVGLNELANIMIFDKGGTLNEGKLTTILAERGIVDITDTNQNLLIYKGTQYQKDAKTGQISRLNFDQYTLDIPIDNDTIVTRWKEPDERTFDKLFIFDEAASAEDLKNRDEFIAEIHRRLSTPFLYPTFMTFIILFLLLGEWNRRSPSKPLIKSGVFIVAIQALYIVISKESQSMPWVNFLLYLIVIAPLFYSVHRINGKEKLF